MKNISPRTAAAQVIGKILGSGAYSNIALSNALNQSFANESDKKLFTRIVLTAVERAKTLDYIISPYCKQKLTPILKGLLFTGAVQILYMDRVPSSAACDETVKAAKELTDKGKSGFVNAVLRSICREKQDIRARLAEAPEDVVYSVDGSLLELLKNQYPDNYKEIISCFDKEYPTFIRYNTLKLPKEEIVKILEADGVEIQSAEGFDYISKNIPEALKHIEDGLFFVQGYASQYAVRLLDAKPGDTVIDACACPGGKTIGASVDMENKGKIYALDLHENKLSLIQKTAKRMGADIISVKVHDGRNPIEAMEGVADKVICDVPCSALGVIGSRPEIRYKDVSNLSQLIKTQYEILCASAKYLKNGGVLVYSTCTFDIDENHRQIEKFISEHGDFTVTHEKQFLPDGVTDGFYCCRIVKNG